MHRVHYAVGVWDQHFPAPTSVPRGPNRTSYSGNRRPANPLWPSDSSAQGFLLLNSCAAFIHWFIFQLLVNFFAFFCLLGLVLWIALVFEADAWIRGNGFWKMFPNKLQWTTIYLTKTWQTSPNNSVYIVSATCIVVVGPLWPDHYKIFCIWGIWKMCLKMLKSFAVI